MTSRKKCIYYSCQKRFDTCPPLSDWTAMLPNGLLYRLAMKARPFVIRRWYDLMSRIDRHDTMLFMNYGWADLDPQSRPIQLDAGDENDRYCIQLYYRVAGAADLGDKDVLEIGSGRGGGASWVMRRFGLRTMTGLDFSPAGVGFCNSHYRVPGLSFVTGDAEALHFEPDSFDAVINVESSHCYGSMDRFLAGVFRVLKPGGCFLYSDYHSPEGLCRVRTLLADSGFETVSEEDISANVVRALELDDDRKASLIDRLVPRILRGLFREFAGMQGTSTFNGALRNGTRKYSRFVLSKPARRLPFDADAAPRRSVSFAFGQMGESAV